MLQTPHQARHAAVHIRPRMLRQLAAEGLPEAPAQAPGELPRGSLRPTGGDARDGMVRKAAAWAEAGQGGTVGGERGPFGVRSRRGGRLIRPDRVAAHH